MYIVIFLVALSCIELLILADRKKGIVASSGMAALITICLCLYFYFGQGSSYAREIQPLNLLFTNLIIAAVPTLLFLYFAYLSRNFEGAIVTHSMALAFSLVTSFGFPFFVLVTGCYTGLDCI